jgi:hypothetical protein
MLEILHVVAQWAGATSVIALMGCIIAAAIGMQFSQDPLSPAAEAFELARTMALVGGSGVIVAGAAATLYWWQVGVVSTPVSAAVVSGLAVSAIAFAAAVRVLRARSRAIR